MPKLRKTLDQRLAEAGHRPAAEDPLPELQSADFCRVAAVRRVECRRMAVAASLVNRSHRQRHASSSDSRGVGLDCDRRVSALPRASQGPVPS